MYVHGVWNVRNVRWLWWDTQGRHGTDRNPLRGIATAHATHWGTPLATVHHSAMVQKRAEEGLPSGDPLRGIAAWATFLHPFAAPIADAHSIPTERTASRYSPHITDHLVAEQQPWITSLYNHLSI